MTVNAIVGRGLDNTNCRTDAKQGKADKMIADGTAYCG